MTTTPPEEPRRGRLGARETIQLVVAVLLVVYAVLFVVMNSDDVEISFVFFTATTSLVVALLLVAVVGFLLGWLVRAQAERARRR